MLLEVVQTATYGYNYTGMSVDAVGNSMFISASSCNHSSLIGCLKILNMTLDVARCLGCLWMHKLYLDAPGQLYR